MPSQNEIRETITNTIIEALAKGTAPWRRPWSSDPCAGSPKNAVSGKSYSGVNPLLLQIAADRHGFTSRYWATYRQWSELGCQVKGRPSHVPSGSWGQHIIFCKPCKKRTSDEQGDETGQTFFMLRTYVVFNADQVEGARIDRFRVGSSPIAMPQLDERYKRAEDVVEATGADIRFGGDQAYYRPSKDFIQMPNREQFSNGEFFETLFHELCHWTEHPTRLNWDRSKAGNTYALGELIAELGSCFIAGELGLPIEQSLGNHASYLQHWIDQMKGDSRFIFRASSLASKAADFVLAFSREHENEEQADEVLIV